MPVGDERKLLNGILAFVKATPILKKEHSAHLLKHSPTRSIGELHTKREIRSYDWFNEEIKEYGIQVPITIKPDGTIIDGVIRYAAAFRAGHTHVPVEVT